MSDQFSHRIATRPDEPAIIERAGILNLSGILSEPKMVQSIQLSECVNRFNSVVIDHPKRSLLHHIVQYLH